MVAQHRRGLRRQDLVTGRARYPMQAKDGRAIEVFERLALREIAASSDDLHEADHG